MKTAVIGFPRIGEKRELKKAEESYFAGSLNEGELIECAKELRQKHWLIQKEAGIDYISSNDFSLYDTFLDTAVMLGLIPSRYKEASLSPLDTYFALARGYQKDNIDVKPLPMKKWFTTNYHYIVPEIGDESVFSVDCSKIINEYNEAEKLGITTVPYIHGPFTFLKKSHFTGAKSAADFAESIALSYAEILLILKAEGINLVRFDESALCEDLDEADIVLFNKVYSKIFEQNNESGIILQTSFGDTRDIYTELIKLPFKGFGFDFIEGDKTLSLIKDYGFPKGKLLFAGLVYGKNIWKNNYDKTLQTISELNKYAENIVISTSSSLLHVPYTVQNESTLSQNVIKHFSFAKEKLTELRELSTLADISLYEEEDAYIKNIKDRTRIEQIHKKIPENLNAHCSRKTPRYERRTIQKEYFNLPLLPTTTIGSFPQKKEIRTLRSDYKKGSISLENYENAIKESIARCITLQENLGLDVLVHGEYERNDMAEYFGENLNGFVITKNAWVQSYGTRCVKPPVIFSDISRLCDITVKWITYAQSLTSKRVKGMLTGPTTIVNWSFPCEDIPLDISAYQIAQALREEVLSLEKNGIEIIQIDEAALKERLPLRKIDRHEKYLDWAVKAFRYCSSGVKDTTQIHTHMCYSEFTGIISDIDNLDADVITFESSRSALDILYPLKDHHFETQTGPGVYDIHSSRIPSADEIEECIEKILAVLPYNAVWINPDCGLKTRTDEQVYSALHAMMEAVKRVRTRLVNENKI